MLKEKNYSRNNSDLPPTYRSIQVKKKAKKPLLQLFMEHLEAMKKELR